MGFALVAPRRESFLNVLAVLPLWSAAAFCFEADCGKLDFE
jgi:hypothetical protein